MVGPSKRSAAVLMLVTLAGAGCQDVLTIPDRAATPTPLPLDNKGAYVCFASEAVPTSSGRYRYSRFGVRFPRSAEAVDGSTQKYKYRMMEAGKIIAAANCDIPNTAEAVRLMGERLGASDGRADGHPVLAPRMNTGPCGGKDQPPCTLDGITVIGSRPPNYSSWVGGGSGYAYEEGWGSSNFAMGGGSTGEPESQCDPQYDPTCYVILTPEDQRAIEQSLNTYTRKASEFTDPAAVAECAEMVAKFEEIYAAGKVFRGATETQPGDPGVDPHKAAYDAATGYIHFDPSYLDKAATGDPLWQRDLANSALHEAAHALGHDHTEPVWGFYAEPYFSRLSPGANSCLK